VDELLNKARLLFVGIIELAVADVKRDPKGSTVDGDKAYNWFWSDSFAWWCELVGWDDDYKIRALRDKIENMRTLGKVKKC
jgi:hypothetical protein